MQLGYASTIHLKIYACWLSVPKDANGEKVKHSKNKFTTYRCCSSESPFFGLADSTCTPWLFVHCLKKVFDIVCAWSQIPNLFIRKAGALVTADKKV